MSAKRERDGGMTPRLLAGEVGSALARQTPSEPRRRVIAAVMLVHGCSFEEAAAGLDAAVQHRLKTEPGSVSWNSATSLTVWVQSASLYVGRSGGRHVRGQLGNVVALFPEAAL